MGIAYPIIQGPFGGGISTTTLAATVSNAGGLGSFGAHHLDAEQIRTITRELRGKTDKPFAINLWVSDHDAGGLTMSADEFDKHVKLVAPYFHELGVPLPSRPDVFGHRFEDQVEAVLAAAPPVFSFVFGIPSRDILKACRERKIVTIGTATTVDEAVALDDAGVDVIVCSGSEAGGHRGSFLRPVKDSLTGTLPLVAQAVVKVRAPIVAAGGIADGRGIAAAFSLGASAVQIGTAFLACDESGASAQHRAALFSAEARDTVLTRVFTGRIARGIRNRLATELEAQEAEVAPYPAQGWLLGAFKAACIAQGRTDLMSLWAGQATGLLREHRAEQLMRRLVTETTQTLASMAELSRS
jgi:nitronate monooxygenase